MFRYASPSNRCPLCGGTTDCRESDSGAIHCRRTPAHVAPLGWRYGTEDSIGFHVWFPDGHDDGSLADWARPHRGTIGGGGLGGGASGFSGGGESKKEKRRSASAVLDKIRLNHRPLIAGERSHLAWQFVCEDAVLDTMPVTGWTNEHGQFAWVSEEKDGFGRVVGYSLRYRHGKRLKLTYGARGLVIPDGWDRQQPGGPVYCPEGLSDTMGLIAMGLNAVGRPSNTGGAEHLLDLLDRAGFREDVGRIIYIVAENDQKEDGTWPGRDGAEKTATFLAKRLGRPVYVIYPPAGFKDVREFLQAHRDDLVAGKTTHEQLGDGFRNHALWVMEEFGPTGRTKPMASASIAVATIEMPITIEEIAAAPAPKTPTASESVRVNFANLNGSRLSHCPHESTIILRHDEKRLNRILFAPCKRLDCIHCGAIKRAQWKATIAARVNEWVSANPTNTDGSDRTLYFFWCDEKQWKAIHQKMTRQGNRQSEGGLEFYRAELDGGEKFAVLSTVDPRCARFTPEYDSVKKLTPAEAKGRMMAVVDQIRAMSNKSFTGSRAWKKLVGEGDRKPMVGWKRAGKFTIDREKAMEILEFRGIVPEIKKTVGRFWTRTFWEFGDSEAGSYTSVRGIGMELREGMILPDLSNGWGPGGANNEKGESDEPVDCWDSGSGAGDGIWVNF